jgi:hypothetical protein
MRPGLGGPGHIKPVSWTVSVLRSAQTLAQDGRRCQSAYQGAGTTSARQAERRTPGPKGRSR